MALFKRGKDQAQPGAKPADSNALSAALYSGTLEEFLAHYDSSLANYDGYSGTTMLSSAVGNTNLDGRIAISHRLLDDGADPAQGYPLHSLLGRNEHDFQREPELLKRMLDLGADVNKRYDSPGNSGTPLETLVRKAKFSDSDLAPFYDVLLERPDLDLLQPGQGGRPVLVNLRRMYDSRGDLVERCEALLRERGIPVPPPENPAP